MIKNITALVGIMLMVSCSTVETVTTPTVSRKAIIEGDEVTLVTTHKISLSQYNLDKNGNHQVYCNFHNIIKYFD